MQASRKDSLQQLIMCLEVVNPQQLKLHKTWTWYLITSQMYLSCRNNCFSKMKMKWKTQTSRKISTKKCTNKRKNHWMRWLETLLRTIWVKWIMDTINSIASKHLQPQVKIMKKKKKYWNHKSIIQNMCHCRSWSKAKRMIWIPWALQVRRREAWRPKRNKTTKCKYIILPCENIIF